MIRSSSRKVKPTSKFEEFKLTSNGKKRGRPRKSIDGVDQGDSLTFDRSITPVSAKQEPELIQQPETPQSLGQNQLQASPQPQQTPQPPPTQQQQAPQPQQIQPRQSQLRQSQSQQLQPQLSQPKQEHHYPTQTRVSSTPIREPKSNVTRPISSRKEEMMRLREENLSMKSQIEQLNADYEELKRQTSYTGLTVPKIDYDDLKERYERDMINAKRHEWCVVCLTQSKYYCCWNTTYCSQKCQVADWYARHGRSCERRKSYTKM